MNCAPRGSPFPIILNQGEVEMRRFECKTTQPSWRREPLDRATAAWPRLSTLVRARLPCRRRLLARSRPPRGSPPRSPPLASPPRHTLASGSPRLSSPRLSPPAPRFMLASVLNARLASHPRFLARSPRLLTRLISSSTLSSPPVLPLVALFKDPLRTESAPL